MIDVESSELLTLHEAAKLLNRRRPVHLSTLYRWFVSGVRGQKLETILIGGSRMTTKEAVFDFLRRINAPRDGQKPAQPEPPSARARRAVEKCKAIGV